MEMKGWLLVLLFLCTFALSAYGYECTSCNGHGNCSVGGNCVCNKNYAGFNCGYCAPGYRIYPYCLSTRQAGYVGCFAQSKDATYISISGNMHIQMCQSLCWNSTYAVLRSGGRCACQNDYGDYINEVHNNACDMPCTGDALQFCGSSTVGSVYLSNPDMNTAPVITRVSPTILDTYHPTTITIEGVNLARINGKLEGNTERNRPAEVVIINPSYSSHVPAFSTSSVPLGEYPCRIILNSATLILCEVSANIGGRISVRVTTESFSVSSGLSYTRPTITSISAPARVREYVTIYGTDFFPSSKPYSSISSFDTYVLYNSKHVEINSISVNQSGVDSIVFIAPILDIKDYLFPSTDVVRVVIGGQVSKNQIEYQLIGCDNSSCSFHGICTNPVVPICNCNQDYTGKYCEIYNPNNLPLGCNNDKVCNAETESCLNCPNDCNCSFTGGKLAESTCLPHLVNTNKCQTNYTSIVGSSVKDFMLGYVAPVSGTMFAYFQVKAAGVYLFRIKGSNLGAQLIINQQVVVSSYFSNEMVDGFGYINLRSGAANIFNLSFFSNSNNNRSFEIFFKGPDQQTEIPFNEYYYSNECTYMSCNTTAVADESYCGDGMCTAQKLSSCIQDCHQFVTTKCSALQAPDNHLNPFYVEDDTLGNMLWNQFVYHLPGLERIQYAIDIVTGKDAIGPIFYFGYCNKLVQNIVQDTYRASIYNLPDEVSAVPLPRCTFSAETTTFSSSSELRTSMASSSGLDVSASAGGGSKIVQVSVSAAYSEHSSVLNTQELETRRSGSISKTQLQCSSSKLEVTKFTFHPIFVEDISKADTVSKMQAIISKYGTHYYKSAVMGGKLEQISIMDSQAESRMSSKEVQDSTQMSFSASVSSPVFGSASASYSESVDSNIKTSDQTSFESSSSRSSIKIYGGAPGSFGPTDDTAPSSFGDWAATIDLLPVPINYTLGRIGDIIPSSWVIGASKTSSGRSAKEAWEEAELNMYTTSASSTKNYINLDQATYSLHWYFTTELSSVWTNLGSVEPHVYLAVNFTGRKQLFITEVFDVDALANRGLHAPLFEANNRVSSNFAKSPLVFSFVAPNSNRNKIQSIKLYWEGTSLDLHSVLKTKMYAMYDTSQSKQYQIVAPNLNSGLIKEASPSDVQLFMIFNKVPTEGPTMEIVLFGSLGKTQTIVKPTADWGANVVLNITGGDIGAVNKIQFTLGWANSGASSVEYVVSQLIVAQGLQDGTRRAVTAASNSNNDGQMAPFTLKVSKFPTTKTLYSMRNIVFPTFL